MADQPIIVRNRSGFGRMNISALIIPHSSFLIPNCK